MASSVPRRRRGLALSIWLVLLAVAAAIVVRAPFVADMSIFLPQRPTAEQRLLVENLRSGVLTRILLVGVEGLAPAQIGPFSRELGERLRASGGFRLVANGDLDAQRADQRLLLERRYLLSPAIDAAHFEVPALHEALQQAIDELSSSQGLLLKSLLPRDPTGEMFRLLNLLQAGTGPTTHDGVWTDPAQRQALLIAYTRADGSDVDGQQRAIDTIRQSFDTVRTHLGATAATLHISGPGMFAVQSRASIERDIHRLSTLGTVLIVALLWFVFRSPVAMLLCVVPLLSAMLAGAAAVALGFGRLHGLTLGFGIPLVGEAVDYALYQLVRAGRGDAAADASFWRTIALGVTTSVVGFSALALSGFPGLTQMAVFSIAGLLAAVAATRFVLPALTPAGFRVRDLGTLDARLHRFAARIARSRRWLAILTVVALAVVALRHDRLWDDDIASLNPISAAAGQLDQQLRQATHAPDVRNVLVITAGDQQAALQGAERLAPALDAQVAAGRLAGYQSPASFLPSRAMQLARRAALPAPDVLRERLRQAAEGLPIRPDKLAPFVDDVSQAREQPLIERQELEGTQLGLQVASLLMPIGEGYAAIIALNPPAGGSVDGPALLRALEAAGATATATATATAHTHVTLLDIKRETDRLYAGYLHEAIVLSAGGALAIVALLALSLRSARGLWQVCAPLLGAVVLTLFVFTVTGHRMNLLHLVGLLLVVAVGSNYTLFFRGMRRAPPGARRDGTLASVVFANLATVAGFGVLAGASVPLLSALGGTVAIGAALALLLACAWIMPQDDP